MTMTPDEINECLKTLGLTDGESKTKQDIKIKYRALVLIYHPDKSGDASTADKFSEISSAYQRLNSHFNENHRLASVQYTIQVSPSQTSSNRSSNQPFGTLDELTKDLEAQSSAFLEEQAKMFETSTSAGIRVQTGWTHNMFSHSSRATGAAAPAQASGTTSSNRTSNPLSGDYEAYINKLDAEHAAGLREMFGTSTSDRKTRPQTTRTHGMFSRATGAAAPAQPSRTTSRRDDRSSDNRYDRRRRLEERRAAASESREARQAANLERRTAASERREARSTRRPR